MLGNSTGIVLLFFVSFVISTLLTLLVRRVALKYRVINEPSSRGLHEVPTPRGGGLAIVLVWYVGITLLYLNDVIDGDLYPALMTGIALAAISFLDDVIQVSPKVRLIIQFAVVIAAFWMLGGLRKPISLGIDVLSTPYITYPLAIVGMVWFINLFNFMDGADGFASLEAITVALVLYLFTGSVELILLMSAVLGFLYWNWPRAKIFMGDVGSTQLGFILVVLGIHYHNTLDFSIFNWLMITAPFWFDATLTLYRRWRNGEHLSQAHRKHAYQRFILSGFSHKQLNLALLLVNILIFLLIVLYREWNFLKIPIYILTLVFLYFLVRAVDKLFPFPKN